MKTVERNLYTRRHILFVHRGLKLVQSVKIARKHERFIEDLKDDIRVRPGFGFYLRPSYCSLGTCKAQ